MATSTIRAAGPHWRPASMWPGLVYVAVLVGAAYGLSQLMSTVSAPLWAFGLGLLAAPAARAAHIPAAGIAYASRTPLRAGIALLGLTVAASQLLSLGFAGVAVAAVVVVVTMVGTSVVARALGLDRDVSLLIATGTAICGASAIAAVETLTDSSEENVGYALITVTVFGTIAMVTTPVLALHVLHLDARQTGLWLGGSIHEVAQVAGAGAAASAAALQAAVLTKLTRVVMLAPTTAVIALRRGRRSAAHAVPGFVLAFLAFAALRSVANLPESIVTAGHTASTLLLSAGLCALATQIDVKRLAAVGMRPLGLGLAAWLIASSSALATALLVTS